MYNYGATGRMTHRAGYHYPVYNSAMMAASRVPYHGFGYGASVFAYGAIARMTSRVAYYESYYNGYWGNNPARYYIAALGHHARSIAVPGGRPVAAPGRAAKGTAPAAEKAAASGDRSNATGNADSANNATKAKDDPEAKEREEARKKLDKHRDGAVSKLVNERGYTESEAKAIVDMVYDKVQNDGKAAPENFASYINGVPAKTGKDSNGRPVKDPTWALKYGKWVAKLKGANKPERAAADTCAEFKVQRGRRLRNNVDYARIEEDSTEKIGDKVYARYRVIKGKGRNGEALSGRLYYDKDGGKRKWGTKDDSGQFVALRRQPRQHNNELGVISFGSGRLVAVPRPGLSANQINVAIDEWLKRHPAGKKVETPGAGYAKDVKDRLVRFFGTRNGKKAVDVTIDNGKNIVIKTVKGGTELETGANANFIQQRIRDKKGEFNSIIKGLGKNASVSVDGEFVSGVGGSGAADSVIEILGKKAVKTAAHVFIKDYTDWNDPIKRVAHVTTRIDSVRAAKDVTPQTMKDYATLRFKIYVAKGKETNLGDTVEKAKKHLEKTFPGKKIIVDVVTMSDGYNAEQVRELKRIDFAGRWHGTESDKRLLTVKDAVTGKSILDAAVDYCKQGVEATIDGSTKCLAKPYGLAAKMEKDQFIKHAQEMQADLKAKRISKADYEHWYNGATITIDGKEVHVGAKAILEKYFPTRVKEFAPEAKVKRTGRNSTRRGRKGPTRRRPAGCDDPAMRNNHRCKRK